MWVGLIPALAWVVSLQVTDGTQHYTNTRPRVPYYGNTVYNQRQNYQQAMTPRLQKPQSFSATRHGYRPPSTYSQRPAQRSAAPARRPGVTSPSQNPARPQNKRQKQYNAMLARRRMAARRYRIRAQTCDPRMSLYCRCSRTECAESEIPMFLCGYRWSGQRCCRQWWFMRCMMSEIMGDISPQYTPSNTQYSSGQGGNALNSRNTGRQTGSYGPRMGMSFSDVMMAPFLMEALEI